MPQAKIKPKGLIDLGYSGPLVLPPEQTQAFYGLMASVKQRLEARGEGHFLKDKPDQLREDPKVQHIAILNQFGEAVSGAIIMVGVGRSGTSPAIAESLFRYPLAGEGDATAVIGSLMTATAHGGLNLAEQVLDKAIGIARSDSSGKIKYVLASVATDNKRSQEIFKSFGFNEIGLPSEDFDKGHTKQFFKLTFNR